MDADAERVRRELGAGRSVEATGEVLAEEVMAELAQEGADLPARYEIACPAWMNAQGLARYWARREARS